MFQEFLSFLQKEVLQDLEMMNNQIRNKLKVQLFQRLLTLRKNRKCENLRFQCFVFVMSCMIHYLLVMFMVLFFKMFV